MARVRKNFDLPPDVLEKLEVLAKKTGKSMNQICIEAFEAYFKKNK